MEQNTNSNSESISKLKSSSKKKPDDQIEITKGLENNHKGKFFEMYASVMLVRKLNFQYLEDVEVTKFKPEMSGKYSSNIIFRILIK